MENVVIQLSKYVIIILFTIYTFYCFTMFRNGNKERQKRICRYQSILMYLIHVICHLLLFLDLKEQRILILYGLETVFLFVAGFVYKGVYKNMSQLIFNNMRMFLVISFVMLLRLDYDLAERQLMMAAIGMTVCLIVPFVIDKFKYFDKLGWLYELLGILCLFLVFIPGIGVTKYGASNWIQIGGFSLQPSEFVKILFVFFIAALLSQKEKFKDIIMITIGAAIYVLILVAERDLGAALLYFTTYLVVLYVATAQPLYMIGGLSAGAAAAVFASKFFSHVQVRISAWQNPFKDIDTGGYQLANSLFAIGTGGWFGMGLGKGLPTSIPLSESDFIFPAISEELGGIFAVCLILVYVSCYIMFVNIAMKMRRRFYKLTAVGLGTMFICQVLLNVGGVTRFIPSTGVTLPLISYGGSSVLSTIVLFSIIQGMYVLNQDDRKKRETSRSMEAKNEKTQQTKGRIGRSK